MFSYWEQQSFTRYEHIVIGAGIVGMSVGIELRQRFPQDRILILERGYMPTGASSRNAGFACTGSATELLADLQSMTESELLRLYAARKKGLKLLRHRLGDQAIGYAENGSYELISEAALPAMDRLDYLNRLLYPINEKNAFLPASEKIAGFGFSTSYTKALIENTCEGELNTGMMLRALSDLALQHRIEIKTGVSVSRFEEEENAVSVLVPDALRQETWKLNCRNLFICTNAFTKALLPQENVIPGRGQVMITKPIPGLRFKGIFHFEDGYYYFRELDGSVLFGGGRNLDFETERTDELQLNNEIQAALDNLLREVILPGVAFEVKQRWSGIMGFGDTRMPVVKAFSNRVYGAFRMGGMGVALGSEVAQRLVTEIIR